MALNFSTMDTLSPNKSPTTTLVVNELFDSVFKWTYDMDDEVVDSEKMQRKSFKNTYAGPRSKVFTESYLKLRSTL